MDELRKLVVVIFGVAVSITLSILVMIHGWGLEPKSYWWIIGIGFGGQIFAQIIIAIGAAKK